MNRRRTWAEPWKIKMIEPIRMTTRTEREEAARAAPPVRWTLENAVDGGHDVVHGESELLEQFARRRRLAEAVETDHVTLTVADR